MYQQRRQLMIVSLVTLILTFVIVIISFFTFLPLLISFAFLFIAISIFTDGLARYLHFQQQEGILQIMRGLLILCLFFFFVSHFLLKSL